ncbi:sentrin-specific protease 2-like isoform X1 [Larus michahellis]|uniref:sentrin-specific protease 2-like isoform X1 n=1 Tax=Larus michahellis TaxID=119627 RepID=UPI003D9AEC6C
MEREVVAALGKGEPEEILSSAFKLRVTRQDVHTLRKLCWLNDEVINFYMGLVMERSKREGYPSVHAFSSFFYEKLASGGYKAVGRWTRRVDLFQRDIILVPINLRLHWTLAVIDTRKKTVKYYDSLGQGGDKICETLLKYLQEESREKRNMELNVSEWTVHSMEPHVSEHYLHLKCELELLVTKLLTLFHKARTLENSHKHLLLVPHGAASGPGNHAGMKSLRSASPCWLNTFFFFFFF